MLPSNVADAQRIPFCRPCLASMCPVASETNHTLLSFGIEIQLVSTIISWMVSEEVGGMPKLVAGGFGWHALVSQVASLERMFWYL